MYTNIGTDHALDAISKWLDTISLPEGFPLAAVKAAMELVMCNNIFTWGGLLLPPTAWHSHGHICSLYVGYYILFSP